MPLTFPAHQGLVAWTKLRWPGSIDATALCIGAAAPDLAYPLGDTLASQSHSATGVLLWALPVTVLAAWIARTRSAAGIFAHLPDLGPLRLRSYRVVATASPPLVVTVASALLGAGSHVLIDSFTHAQRAGAQLVGFDHDLGPLGPFEAMPISQVLQGAGHIVGSALFGVLVVQISRRQRLEAWYGADQVHAARNVQPTARSRLVFWGLIMVACAAAVVAAPPLGVSVLFLPITVGFVAILVAGVIVPESDVSWARPIRRDVGPWAAKPLQSDASRP